MILEGGENRLALQAHTPGRMREHLPNRRALDPGEAMKKWRMERMLYLGWLSHMECFIQCILNAGAHTWTNAATDGNI